MPLVEGGGQLDGNVNVYSKGGERRWQHTLKSLSARVGMR
jgi:hypothetical protein